MIKMKEFKYVKNDGEYVRTQIYNKYVTIINNEFVLEIISIKNGSRVVKILVFSSLCHSYVVFISLL